MTDTELLRRCIAAEYTCVDGFLVIVNQLFNETFFDLFDNLPVRSLGQYPSKIDGDDDTTHLWIECSHVRKYIARVRK